jgi:hypothetical protein
VKEAALELHADIMTAWNNEDARALGGLLGPDLLVEWKRRLKDFKRKGWHNVSVVLHEPTVEYVGLVNRAEDAEDRVVVHIEVALHDVVTNRHGHTITRNEDSNADGVITQVLDARAAGRRVDPRFDRTGRRGLPPPQRAGGLVTVGGRPPPGPGRDGTRTGGGCR